MRVPSLRWQQQHWQDWNQFGLTRVFLSASRYDWCAPLSHQSSCMLENHGPSQQSSKEEYKPMEMRCYRRILHISYKDHVTNEEGCAKIQQAIGPQEDLLTILKRRKSAAVWSCFSQESLPKPSCKAQWKGEEDKVDRGRGGKTTSGNGQAWSSASPRGQWRTGKIEKTDCKIICCAPTTLAVKGSMMMMKMSSLLPKHWVTDWVIEFQV